MIKNILHKGLKKFYSTGDITGIKKSHTKKLRFILARLESIHKPEDMLLPGFDFHKLIGNRKGQYSVTVQKNWRVVFKFDDTDAYDVNLEDYH